MKKIIAILLAVVLLLAGCQKASPEEDVNPETIPELTMSRPATYDAELQKN